MSHAEQIEALNGLLERVTEAPTADPMLDRELCWHLGVEPWAGSPFEHIGFCMPGSKMAKATPAATRSVDAALALVSRVLPGWWVTSGLCSLSGHASIGPDYNGPAGERLKAEFPPERFDHGGFDADLKPGDGPHRQCLAILACLLSAKLALLTQEESNG